MVPSAPRRMRRTRVLKPRLRVTIGSSGLDDVTDVILEAAARLERPAGFLVLELRRALPRRGDLDHRRLDLGERFLERLDLRLEQFDLGLRVIDGAGCGDGGVGASASDWSGCAVSSAASPDPAPARRLPRKSRCCRAARGSDSLVHFNSLFPLIAPPPGEARARPPTGERARLRCRLLEVGET